MSRSNTKGKSFLGSFATKVKKQPTGQSNGRPSSRHSSYIPQVQEKIENLERKESLRLQQSLFVSGSGAQESTDGDQQQPFSLQYASLTHNEFPSLSTGNPSLQSAGPSSIAVGCNPHQSLRIAPLLQSLRSIHEQNGAESGQNREINPAEHLTNADEIMSCYFNQMIKTYSVTTSDDSLRESDTKNGHGTSCHEILLAATTSDDQPNRISNLPLKLTLFPLNYSGTNSSKYESIFEAEYGPLRTVLQIGNIELEWDDSSLVIPRLIESDFGSLQSYLPHKDEWVDITMGHNTGMRLAAEQRGFHKEITLAYVIDSTSVQSISAVVDTIVKYTSVFYHDVIRRNCQHFVSDVLKALGVERPITLTHGLAEYYKALKEGRSKSVPDKFQSHSELNVYVKRVRKSGDFASLGQQDLEYLLAQYLVFHLQSKCALKDDPMAADGWKCGVVECLMNEVEECIKIDSLRIHNFRT